MPILRAISIKQPFVEQILRGTKRKEYRSKLTNIRERVYIYASAKPKDNPAAWRQVGVRPGGPDTRAIVGTVEITGCNWDARAGEYAYTLKNPKRLRKHLKAVNQPLPGFWRPRFK